jgi:hypothetical protein
MVKVLEIERGSTKSHSQESSLWRRLRTFHKTNNVVMIIAGIIGESMYVRRHGASFVATFLSAIRLYL